MILIADSGSTKTDWCCVRSDGSFDELTTVGLNPNYTSDDTIIKVMQGLPYPSDAIASIYFYGSGCGSPMNVKGISDALLRKFPDAECNVVSDLLGAAKACLGNQKGIIAILGTGSNSGVYDGSRIVEAHPSLGHILADYGSGVDIGKQLLRDYFYKKMPAEIAAEMEISRDYLIEQLYHKGNANTFIASHVGLIFKYADTHYIQALIGKIFDHFIKEEVLNYASANQLTINFVGSIAYLFRGLLRDRLKNNGLAIGKVIQKPIERLREYHYIHEFKK